MNMVQNMRKTIQNGLDVQKLGPYNYDDAFKMIMKVARRYFPNREGSEWNHNIPNHSYLFMQIVSLFIVMPSLMPSVLCVAVVVVLICQNET
jgi:hypothetical protein